MSVDLKTAAQLAAAVDRQLAHRRAASDGESPYYDAEHTWCADLWAADVELVIADYLRQVAAIPHNPLRSDGAGGYTTAGNSEGI